MEIRKGVQAGFFEKILSGEKKFEVRLANFECKKGDTLILEEEDAKTGKLTGRILKKKITYVTKTKDLKYWPKEDVEKYWFQVMQLED